MKRLVSLATALMLVVSLAACGSQKQANMTIRPSVFSKETDEVLSLFDDEVQFFDIKLDDTVKSYSMILWAYQNGEWEEAGRTEGKSEFLGSRIAIRLTENSYDLYTADETGNTKFSYPTVETGFENSIAKGGEKIDREIPLELNKETPIWVKIGTDTGSMRVGDITDDFRQADCNAGIAVTLTVSDQIVE